MTSWTFRADGKGPKFRPTCAAEGCTKWVSKAAVQQQGFWAMCVKHWLKYRADAELQRMRQPQGH